MSGNKLDVHFSSVDPNWRTPWEVYHWWAERYFFDVDAAAEEHSKLAQYFFSADGIDALTTRWGQHGSRFWINPPYGRTENACGPNCVKKSCERRGHHLDKEKPGIDRFIAKAATEAWDDHLLVVALIPARTDTDMWHKYVMRAESIHFVNGRIPFITPGGTGDPAPFPNAFVVFNDRPQTPTIHSWDYRKELAA